MFYLNHKEIDFVLHTAINLVSKKKYNCIWYQERNYVKKYWTKLWRKFNLEFSDTFSAFESIIWDGKSWEIRINGFNLFLIWVYFYIW